MHFFNLYIPNLRAQEYVSSDPVKRATWLNLSAFCCEQENGGRIVGAAMWTERQWMACGVTRREAMHCAPLITFDGDDAIVWAYPANSEITAQNKRLNGRRGGLAKAANATSKTSSVATSVASDLLQAKVDSATSTTSTKEKESKEKESEPSQASILEAAPTLSDFLKETRKAGIPDQFAELKYYWKCERGWGHKWKPFVQQVLIWYRSGPQNNQPAPKPRSTGIKETPMDKLLRENEEMFADGVHPDKWRAANPGKDYIKKSQ